jgi:hypothetical protein
VAASRNKDHDVLIRIDERTEALVKAVETLATTFAKHTEEDRHAFESLKKWRAYITGAVSVITSLGLGSAAWALFK